MDYLVNLTKYIKYLYLDLIQLLFNNQHNKLFQVNQKENLDI